jgi:glycosyltransferase involved in cell wall biosynthesis
VSEHTKRDICHYYQVAPDRISVIPPPVTQITTSLDPQETLSQYSLPEQFYLSVGSLTPRKNVLGILKAMLTLSPGDRIPLVIVGQGSQKAALQNFVKKHRLEKLVIFVGHISNDQLANFYQLAHALIYPSVYEGFGIPIVESLQNKRPVITSRTSSMPEAGGPGALLIDPNKPEEIGENMRRLLTDHQCYDRLVEAGYEHALQYLPANICKKQMELYQSLV